MENETNKIYQILELVKKYVVNCLKIRERKMREKMHKCLTIEAIANCERRKLFETANIFTKRILLVFFAYLLSAFGFGKTFYLQQH